MHDADDFSEEQIAYLQETFPGGLPMEPITPFEQGVLVGQQQVIAHLLALTQKEEDIDVSS